jgi:hypothetical protein
VSKFLLKILCHISTIIGGYILFCLIVFNWLLDILQEIKDSLLDLKWDLSRNFSTNYMDAVKATEEDVLSYIRKKRSK